MVCTKDCVPRTVCGVAILDGAVIPSHPSLREGWGTRSHTVSTATSFHHQIHHLAGHDDHFDDLLALNRILDFFFGEGGFL